MNIAILLSGGTGIRLGGDIPKQYIRVNGEMIISYALNTLLKSGQIDEICIVAATEWQDKICADADSDIKKPVFFAEPGENRQDSILNGMDVVLQRYEGKGGAVDASQLTVLIHDAARPMLTADIIDACYEALPGHDGVMPSLSMKDTVYISEDGRSVSGLLERSKVFAGQAPELFLFEKYCEANRKLSREQLLAIKGSSEPAIMAGMDIVIIPGDERNFKVTTREDLNAFERIVCGG